MENNSVVCKRSPTWQSCVYCPSLFFNSIAEFEKHIQEKHSIKEGSIILCQYGQNGLCAALQFGDLRKAGYKYHIRAHHLYSNDETENWTFYSSSQNLPAVLNDPNRGKQSNFFTKTWGDSFVDKVEIYPSPYLPEITLSHFESYCKKISKRYRRHCKLKETVTKPKSPTIENVCDVPGIFFEQSLSLNDLNVFYKVFPNLNNAQDTAASIRTLQESLSTYLDVIEMKISKQVAQKSDAFFHAMLSHDTIMEQMAKAVKTVCQTRQNISQVKNNLTESSLQLINLSIINKNLLSVHENLKLMGTVQQTQPMIQLLLSTSDYVAALDLITSTQKVLSAQLSGIHAFRHLSPQLTEMKRLINKMLSNEFQRFVVADINRSPSDRNELPERDKLVSIVSGILRLKELNFIETMKAEVITTAQALIKQCVIEIISERDGNTEIVLRGSNADNTWLLCNEGIIFLQKVSCNLIILFKRVMCINNLIIETSQMDDVTGIDNDEFWCKEELNTLEEKLKKMTVSLVDYCHERCSNLILTKTEKDYLFSDLSQLSKLSELIDNFCKECLNITGHSSNAMNLALRSFAMKFIQTLHNERRTQLTATLNTERWKVAEVPNELQGIIDKICECGTIPSNIQYNYTEDSKKADGKFLVINKENYPTVGSVQLLIRIIVEYCDATRKSPIIVQYVIHCILELIRHFNSKCCQLVLGAGAIQSAGLKTITTSNLALLSRSLQVVLWLLPLVRQLLEKLHSNELTLSGFDNIEKDLYSHKQEIENKICFIVSNTLSTQLNGWDAKPPVPSQTFRYISKHLVKLHEAVTDILPIDQIIMIYKRVHDNFKDKLREQLVKMNIVANGSPQHGIVTSELTFYLQTLKTLQVVKNDDVIDNILYEVWLN